jgi:hypothetical protein
MTGYLTLSDYALQAIRVYRDEKGDRPVGLRRLHYWIVSKAERDRTVLRQRNINHKKVWNPEPYQNDKGWYDSLGSCYSNARLDGKIPTDWIIDEKNDDPIWMPDREDVSTDYTYQINTRTGDAPDISYTPMPEWCDLLNGIEIGYQVNGGRFIHQKYRIAVFCEKATNRASMHQVCGEHGADLFIFSGQASTTRAIDLALAAQAEDKPVCLLYINDADPGGMDMMTSAMDKISRIYPRDDHIYERVALTPDQIRKYNLPYAFSVDDKGYKKGIKERFEIEYEGLSPRELDALDESVLISELDKALSQYSNIDQDRKGREAAREQARYQAGMLDSQKDQVLGPYRPGYETIQERFNRICSEIEARTAPLREELTTIINEHERLLWNINQAIQNQGISPEAEA